MSVVAAAAWRDGASIEFGDPAFAGVRFKDCEVTELFSAHLVMRRRSLRERARDEHGDGKRSAIKLQAHDDGPGWNRTNTSRVESEVTVFCSVFPVMTPGKHRISVWPKPSWQNEVTDILQRRRISPCGEIGQRGWIRTTGFLLPRQAGTARLPYTLNSGPLGRNRTCTLRVRSTALFPV